jgi:hypothetical protein
MMLPQCGMLTIGALPSTLPLRMNMMIFASVSNSFRHQRVRTSDLSYPWNGTNRT